MDIPGDPTPQEREEAFERLHERAVETWGAERALALEESLRQTSLAIIRLQKIRFSRNDAPGFYLHETGLGVPWGGAP
jgi:hypothetical protein